MSDLVGDDLRAQMRALEEELDDVIRQRDDAWAELACLRVIAASNRSAADAYYEGLDE